MVKKAAGFQITWFIFVSFPRMCVEVIEFVIVCECECVVCDMEKSGAVFLFFVRNEVK
jgi:hypothetical protein